MTIVQRKLAAIVAADIADYSRLIGQREEDTLQALADHRRELIDPLIKQYGGRIANTAGDSLLLEFASAVNAVRWALAVQKGMVSRNDNIAPEDRIRFRIGINIGDVVVEGLDLLGDGVNVAARLEQMCEPDGICVSLAVYEQVSDKIDRNFDDLGYHKLKNIPHLVHVYRAHLSELPKVEVESSLFERPAIKVETGRCMCGAVQFQITQNVISVGLCHCRMCQRFNSAPFSVWAVFAKEAVQFTSMHPKVFQSSAIGERGFCPDCGSSLTMTWYAPEKSDILAILAPCLDHPEHYAPKRHACVESMVPWLDLNDSLPRSYSWDSSVLRQRWESVGLPDPADWK